MNSDSPHRNPTEVIHFGIRDPSALCRRHPASNGKVFQIAQESGGGASETFVFKMERSLDQLVVSTTKRSTSGDTMKSTMLTSTFNPFARN